MRYVCVPSGCTDRTVLKLVMQHHVILGMYLLRRPRSAADMRTDMPYCVKSSRILSIECVIAYERFSSCVCAIGSRNYCIKEPVYVLYCSQLRPQPNHCTTFRNTTCQSASCNATVNRAHCSLLSSNLVSRRQVTGHTFRSSSVYRPA